MNCGQVAWINLDDGAPPCATKLEPFASRLDEVATSARCAPNGGKSCVLPVNWKLAAALHGGLPRAADASTTDDARRRTHRGASGDRDHLHAHPGLRDGRHDPRNDVRIAEGLQHLSLPGDPEEAMKAWQVAVNDAVTAWHQARIATSRPQRPGPPQGHRPIGFGLPALLLLPQHSSASSAGSAPGPREYVVRDLVADQVPGRPLAGAAHPPVPVAAPTELADDPGAGFSNLPWQQWGLHPRLRVHAALRTGGGLISNFERVIDGFLAGFRPTGWCRPSSRPTPPSMSRSPIWARASGRDGRPDMTDWDESVDLLIAGQRRWRDGRRAGRGRCGPANRW